MANDIVTSKYHENEIAKSGDFQHVGDSLFSAIGQILAGVTGATKNTILSGGVVTQRSPVSMNVDLGAIVAFDATARTLLYSASTTGPVSVSAAHATLQRIDILEIRQAISTYDTQQRAFKDPSLGTVNYQNVDTKQRLGIEVQVKAGTPGAGVAPAGTAGWVKVAEIVVPAAATSILTANIKNADATIPSATNSTWTTESGVTYLLKGAEANKAIFRTPMNEDGTFKSAVIKDANIDFGTGAGQVNLLNRMLALDGYASGLVVSDSERLNGQLASYYLSSASYTAADVLSKLLTVDTDTSGLNATTLKSITIGQTGASYIPYVDASQNTIINSTGFLAVGSGGVYNAAETVIAGRRAQAGKSVIEIDNQNNSASAYSGFRLDSFGSAWDILTGSTAANSNALDFTNGTVRARITSGGNFLIGTTTDISGKLLNVAGAVRTYNIDINTGSASNVYIQYSNAASARWVTGISGTESGSNAGSDFVWQNYTDGGTQIATPMTIRRSNGNVLIGESSTAPGMLKVASSIGVQFKGSSVDQSGVFISSYHNAVNGTYPFGGLFADTFRDVANPSLTAGMWFESHTQGGVHSDTDIVFGAMLDGDATGRPTERMRVKANGNVLIGNTTGTYHLDVGSSADNQFSVVGEGTGWGGTTLARFYSERNTAYAPASFLQVGSAYNIDMFRVMGDGKVFVSRGTDDGSGAVLQVNGAVSGSRFISSVATGTAPLAVSSTTVVSNLNADLHDGYHAGNSASQIPVSNGTVNSTLNADLLDGFHASSFLAPSQVAEHNLVQASNITMNALAVGEWRNFDYTSQGSNITIFTPSGTLFLVQCNQVQPVFQVASGGQGAITIGQYTYITGRVLRVI